MQYVLTTGTSAPSWNGYPLVYDNPFRANYVVSEIVPQAWDKYTALYNGSANEGGAICYFKNSYSPEFIGRYGNTMTAYWAEDGALEQTMSNLSARGLDWDNPDGVNISTMGLQECSSFTYITREFGNYYTLAKRFYPPYGAKSGFIVAGMREDNLGWEMTNIKLVRSGHAIVPVEPEKAIIMHLDTKSINASGDYTAYSNNMNEFKYDSAFNLFVKTPAYTPNDSHHSHIDYISTASAERWDAYRYPTTVQPWFSGHFDHMSGTTTAAIAETGTTYTADGCHIDVL